MRRPLGWFFGALRIGPSLLLAVALLCGAPAFGQTAAPAAGPAPRYTAKEIAGFRVYFMEVMALESSADREKAQGKDDKVARGAIQKGAKLSAQEASLLKQVAQQCNAAYAAETATGIGVVKNLRQQYPPVAGVPPPAEVTEQITALEARQDAIIGGCIQQLQMGMGPDRFGHLDLYVVEHISDKMKHGPPGPGGQGGARPK